MGTLTPATPKAPADYEQLFEQYFDYVVALVQKCGIQAIDAEDVASDIMLKFFERDFLPKFDDNFSTDVAGKRRRSSFTGFLSGFVTTYVLQHKDRQMVRMRKEPVRLEQHVGDTTWVEIFGPSATYEMLPDDFSERARAAYEHLLSLPVRGKRNLARAFEIIVTQVAESGKADRKAIAAEFRVSQTAVCLMIADLRNELRSIGFAPS